MLSNQPDLKQLQKWILGSITHPRGIQEGLQYAAKATGILPAQIDAIIEPSDLQTSQQRLAVYNEAYFARLLSCMTELFPVTAELIGKDAFVSLAIHYLIAYPPSSYSLHHLSDYLEEHLDKHLPSDDPYAICVLDMVRLERAIDQVFDGQGMEEQATPPLHQRLAQVRPEELLKATLVFHPSLKVLAVRSDVNRYYTSYRRDEPRQLPSIFNAPQTMALTRRNYIVRRVLLSEVEQLLLLRAQGFPQIAPLLEQLSVEAEQRGVAGEGARTALSQLGAIMMRLAEEQVIVDLIFAPSEP